MAQVVAHQAAFTAANTALVAVSFGTPYWAKVWLEQTGATLDIWLDTTRESYTQYDLRSSVWASWGPKNLWYYAKALATGQQLQENRGDTNQLGGNFIVDNTGILRYAYRSKDPTDRPTIPTLLAELEKLPVIHPTKETL